MKIEMNFDIGGRVTILPIEDNDNYPLPRYGWGDTKEGDVGVVREVRRKLNYGRVVTDVLIDFPSQANWVGVLSEVFSIDEEEGNKNG